MVKLCLLSSVKLEFNDLLNTSGTENTRNTNVESVYAELALQQSTNRKNPLLIAKDCFSHTNS